jgi:ribonuclease VapC
VSRYVLDSFAVLADYWHEPGAARVRELRHDAVNLFWMSLINIGEVFYRVARTENRQAAALLIAQLEQGGVTFIDTDRNLTFAAADLKTRFALSYADCFAAALAQRMDAAVVTGDREFEQLQRAGLIDIEWLRRARG